MQFVEYVFKNIVMMGLAENVASTGPQEQYEYIKFLFENSKEINHVEYLDVDVT